jgi:protein gp37
VSGKSKIEWTGSTWNPIRARLKEPRDKLTVKSGLVALKSLPIGTWGYHCERVSPGCGTPSVQPKGGGCYACAMNGRTLPAWGTGLDYTRQSRDKVEIYLDETELLNPLHWQRGRFVFPCSMTDLFAEFVPDDFIDRMFAVMALCPQHTFQVLTKRAARLPEFFFDLNLRQEMLGINAELWSGLDRFVDRGGCPPRDLEHRWKLPLSNVWLGVSVEDQQRADERIPHLLATPAALRWVSYEPALAAVDFARWLGPRSGVTGECLQPSRGDRWIDWVVCGGESGPGARPMHPAWVRAVCEQCVAACVPFFFKQWGEFSPCIVSRHVENVPTGDGTYHRMYRVGKKRAGRLLDGREWNEMPAAGARA